MRMKVGLFCPRLSYRGGAEKFAALAAQALARGGHFVELLSLMPVSAASLERAFGCRLDGVRVRPVKLDRRLIARTARYDLFVNNASSFSIPSFAPKSWLWVHDLPERAPRYLDYYKVLANSEFTRREVRSRWGVDCRILHGPVNVDLAHPGAKERMILFAGRLHSRPVPKNELKLIERFAKLWRGGALPGWRLEIAGVLSGPDPRWIERLRAAAGHADVRIRVNPSFVSLRSLYRRASFFWHGCGAEESEMLHPERLEHFGAAVAEAMAAGCVVFAPDRGGPKDFLRNGVNGYLYRDWTDLERKTLLAAERKTSLAAIRRSAVETARRFAPGRFRRELGRMLSEA